MVIHRGMGRRYYKKNNVKAREIIMKEKLIAALELTDCQFYLFSVLVFFNMGLFTTECLLSGEFKFGLFIADLLFWPVIVYVIKFCEQFI